MAERILVVANRTAESAELLETLKRRAAAGPATFTLLVPASAHGFARATDGHAGDVEAADHVQRAVERWRAEGLEVEGRVGDPDPLAAAQDAASADSYDAVIVSTLPTHLSKWLKLDLPNKVAHATGLTVEHVLTKQKDPLR